MYYCVAGKNSIAISAINTLLELGKNKYKILSCINLTDDGEDGWQPSFKKFCKLNHIKIVSLEELFDIQGLYFFSLEYDKIIKTNLFKTKELFNIHFSKLPKHKGMYTSIFPVLFGEEVTGVTLHMIEDGIDTGDIIDQECFYIGEKSSLDLYTKYLEIGALLFKKNIVNLIDGNYKKTKQDSQLSTYNSKSSINFKNIEIPTTQTAFQIKQWVKAFSFRPYQMSTYKGYDISHVIINDDKSYRKPGSELNTSFFHIEIATVDYNVKLFIDRIEEILKYIEIDDIETIKTIYTTYAYNINDWGKHGWTPLMVAAYFGRFEIVKFLIQNGANINAVNFNGTSVLMYAMTYASNTSDTKTLDFLLDQGCNINHVDYRGKSVFNYTIEYGNIKVIEKISNYLNDSIS
jgi:methionyl-tRNA formyltransferase